MEPLMPSEVARLVFDYLKSEKLNELAESFLKSSPHLTECYQMYKTKGSFNTKVNGFNLSGLFDLFGTMCKIINEQIPEAHESKTMIERLLYVISVQNLPSKEDKCVGVVLNVVDKCVGTELNVVDKCVGTELNMVDKCVGDMIYTEDKNTDTTISVESNKNAIEALEIPLLSDIISNHAIKINEIEQSNNKICSTIEKNAFIVSSSSSPLKTQSIYNNKSIQNISDSYNIKLNEQNSSTPTRTVYEEKQIVQQMLLSTPNIIHNYDQSECQQVPEATSLESMPGLSKEDDPKDSSIVIDASELVDTFLNDKSLLEKIANTINKSFETQRETDQVQDSKILDPPTLEKVIDSTQSDPQIKNVLDEFLVFNVDSFDCNKKINPDNQENSIKTRLRSAKKTASNKLKKNNLKHNNDSDNDNEDKCMKIDNNILLISENNMNTLVYDNCDLLSNAAESYNLETIVVNSESEEDYTVKSNFRKIAPKISSVFKTHSALEKRNLPVRKRRNVGEIGIKSQFRKTNIVIQPLESVQQPTQSIIIEVPNQSSFETISNIPEVGKIPSELKLININKDETPHDTPGDRLKPPKNKSLSTPRRRNTHIRCLDFSTPQPKNNARDQARSKLFCDTPKKIDTIVEESVPSPLPKLQVDWGSVNGFEAIVKKDTLKHWDSEIRDMVGAGILTSDADGRKTRKKKTPRKKIKPVNDKNSSNNVSENQNETGDLIQSSEILTTESINSNISESPCDLNKEIFKDPLMGSKIPLKEIPSEFPVLLENRDKTTELCNEQSLNESSSMKKLSTSLETPDKTELITKQPLVESDPLKSVNDCKLSPKPSIFSIASEVPKINLCNELPSNEFSISFNTPVKSPDVCEPQIKFSPNKVQNEHEQPKNNFNELENDLNQLNILTLTNKLATCSKILPKVTNESQEKDSNFLETFNNHKYLKPLQLSTKQTENKSVKPTENVKAQSLGQSETNTTISHTENITSIKHNLETPFKCDESAVDVPETPISKLIREYDPSKLVTPLQSTPVHYEDSLTETPLTKIFRETSYLNRPPISPFPPTPGNSMSVDTLIVPPEQECSKFSCQLNGFLDGKIKDIVKQPIQVNVNDNIVGKTTKVKTTLSKTKKKGQTKIKSAVKKKSLNTLKKQVYESTKVELFGSEISSSSSANEFEKSIVQSKTIVISEKPIKNEKKSGFKPIPRKKSILSTSVSINDDEKHLLDETKSHFNESSSKPSVIQNKESSLKQSKSTSNTTKSKKSMVHFDDPVEQYCVSPIKPTQYKSSDYNVSKLENNTVINKKANQLVGLKAYLEKPLVKCKQKQTKLTEPLVKTFKLNNSSSSAEVNVADLSMEKISSCVLNNRTNEENKLPKNNFENKNIKSSNQKLDEKILNKSSCILSNTTEICDKSYEELKLTDYCTKNKKTVKSNEKISSSDIGTMTKINVSKSSKSNDSGKYENCLEKKDNDILDLNQSESTFINCNATNTSLISVQHEDKSFQLVKDSSTLVDNAFEIIDDDGTSKILYLSLSDKFTLLDLTSEVNVQFSPSITSSSSNKVITIPDLESGELACSDDKIVKHVTSTPKDLEKKIDDRPKHDWCRELPVRRRYNYQDKRHDRKYWSNKSWHQDKSPHFDSWNRFKKNHVKREYDDLIRDSYRSKYTDDKRRSYRDFNRDDDRRGRDRLDEHERPSNWSQKVNKLEDSKKATKRLAERTDHNKTPAKVSKVEHQRLLKNVNVDDFLSVVHGRK